MQEQQSLIDKAKTITWADEAYTRTLIRSILMRVKISSTSVSIQIGKQALINALRGITNGEAEQDDSPINLHCDVKLAAAQNGSKVVIGGKESGQNIPLIKAITRSFLWNDQLINGEMQSIKQIAAANSIASATYVSRIIRLRFLAPDIIESIITGTQPKSGIFSS